MNYFSVLLLSLGLENVRHACTSFELLIVSEGGNCTDPVDQVYYAITVPNKMPIVRNICAVFIAIIATNAYNILIVLPTTFKSHHQIGEELALELLSDGHHVTIVSPFKLNKSVSNYTEIILEHSLIGHDTGKLAFHADEIIRI